VAPHSEAKSAIAKCLNCCQRTGGRRSRELHGFLVKDIASLIEVDCARVCHSGGVGVAGSHVTVDTARRYQLFYRYSYMRHSLRPFGYDFDFHPHFAARLVCALCQFCVEQLRSAGTVSGQGGQTFGENSARSAEIFC